MIWSSVDSWSEYGQETFYDDYKEALLDIIVIFNCL